MPRANRHQLPGCIWHITHRCHKREFLLKFARDRWRWVHWLFQARKRYGLTVLNYMVTSNHIHILVLDKDGESSIPRSMQLIAGRTAQEYNLRKRRKGAFWEDRYHATAVESGEHLRRCMAYIDLNMCRASVVEHPSQWECCGYTVIQNPPRRYQIIDRECTARLLGYQSIDELMTGQRVWTESCQQTPPGRDRKWSGSIAIGSKEFVSDVQARLGGRAHSREVEKAGERFVLREARAAYITDSEYENELLSSDSMPQ